MIHLFFIFGLSSVCIGLLWSIAGLLDRIKELEMECESLEAELMQLHDDKIEELKKVWEYEQGCG